MKQCLLLVFVGTVLAVAAIAQDANVLRVTPTQERRRSGEAVPGQSRGPRSRSRTPDGDAPRAPVRREHILVDGSSRSGLRLGPNEHVLSVPAAAFHDNSRIPSSRNWYCSGAVLSNFDTGSGHLIAPLYLPHGAKITRLAAIFRRTDRMVSPSLKVLRANDYVPLDEGPGLGGEPVCSISGVGSGSERFRMTLSNRFTQPELQERLRIDNLAHSYFMELHLQPEDSFRGAKIFYTTE